MRGAEVEAGFYRATPGGVLLSVRITPKSSKSAIAGLATMSDGRAALAVRIAAPPVDGAANAALLVFLAKRLAIPKSTLTIAAGETSRLKTIEIQGASADLAARLEGIVTP